MKLNARTTTALKTIVSGGYFKKAQEVNGFTRRLKFQTRLYTREGVLVPGFGSGYRNYLSNLGVLTESLSCAGTVHHFHFRIPADPLVAVKCDELLQGP